MYEGYRIEEPISLKIKDDYYLIHGDKYWRVTKVKSIINHEGLNKWRAIVGDAEAKRVLKERGDIGTTMHQSFEQILNGYDVNTDRHIDEIKVDIALFYEFIKNCGVFPAGVEQKLWSEELRIAGTADYIGEYKTYPQYLKRGHKPKFTETSFVLGDWKSSSAIYKDFWLQLGTYVYMFEQLTGKKLDGAFIAQFRNGKIKVEEKTREELDKYIDVMKHCIEIFKYEKGE